jgi:predicted Zn finger-like uncharacterized protein
MPVKVECDKCKTAFQLDERRIPATGLRVRCPKCAHVFVVKKPEDRTSVAPAAGSVPAPAIPVPTVAPATKPEVPHPVGVPKPAPATPAIAVPPIGGAAAPPRKRAATIAFAGAPPGVFAAPPTPAPAPAPAAQPKRPSMMPSVSDLPAVHAGPAPAKPAEPAAFDAIDLPELPQRGAPSLDDLPAMPMRKPSFGDLPAVPAPIARPAEPARDLSDLPAVPARGPAFGDLPAVAAAKPIADLPAVPARGPAAPAIADLPAVPAKGAAAPPAIDLPAIPKGPPANRPRAKTQVGLGAFVPPTGGAAPGAKNGVPKPPPIDELDAPPRGRAMAPSLDDLPAVAAPIVSNPPGGGASPFGEIDLPAVGGAALPQPKGGFGEIDLPAVGGAGLPQAKGGFGEIDLPAVGGAGLPAVGGAALPAAKKASSAFGEIDLPVAASPGLPATREPGGIDLPSPAAHLPAIGGAPQAAKAAPFDPFADMAAADEPVSGGALGFMAGDLSQGNTPLPPGAMPPHAPAPAAHTSGAHDFGELELPGPEARGPRVELPDLGAVNEPKRPRAPSLALDQAPPEVAAMLSGGGAPHASEPMEGGALGFGEVDLGAGIGAGGIGNAGPDDDMEFGAIPQGTVSVPPPARDEPRSTKRETKREADAAPARRSSGVGGRIALGLLAVLCLGGAGLEFTPLGAFGRHAIDDRVHAAEHRARADAMIARTRGAFAEDAMDKAAAALAQNDGDVAALPRMPSVAAYAAYGELAHAIRFGADAGKEAKAKSLLARVKQPSPELDLAQAALALVGNNLPDARARLTAITGRDDKNVDAWVTLGELELKAKQGKPAVAAFEKAIKASDNARTRGGLIRALDAAGERDRAKKEAEALLKKAPSHVGAHLYLAHRAWEDGKNEAETLKQLDEINKPNARNAGSPGELVDASTLRGWVKLDRGQVTEARKAFDDAITAARGVPVAGPQLGLAEVEMTSGAYAKAIAKFGAAAEADPTLVEAKIGIARAQLKQEKPVDARATLAQLAKEEATPKWAGEIGFWRGQAEERISPEKPFEAMKLYENAIKGTPGEVKPYLALASLQAKQGLMDASDKTIVDALAAVAPTDKLYVAIGELRFRQGRYPQALEMIDKALGLGPDNLDAKFDRGRTLLRLDSSRFEEGKKALDEVEAKDKDYPGLALEMGLYYQQTHQLDEALKRYQRALAAAPNDVDVKLQVARAMVESRDANAEKTLREVLEACPTASSAPEVCVTEANHWLGRALLNRAAYNDADQYLKYAATKNDNNAGYHLYYGWNLLKSEKFGDAEIEANRALELDKSLGDAAWIRAEILTRKGQLQEAIKEAKHALELSPARYEAHATIAKANYLLNNEELAIGEYRQAITHDPRNPDADYWRYMVADIYNHRGTPVAALVEIRDAIKNRESATPTPPWLAKAHFYYGEAVRGSDRDEAKKQYRLYLDQSVGVSDPARGDAKAALADLGAPYGGR